MFGKKRKRSIDVTRLSSLVGENVEIRGDVIFSGGLRVDGCVEGNVTGTNDDDEQNALLVLSENGHIKGNVRVHDAVVNGTIVGDLAAEHFVELQAGSRVTGSITYRQLQMDCGATVEGKLDRLADPGDSPARKVVEIGAPPRLAAPPGSRIT